MPQSVNLTWKGGFSQVIKPVVFVSIVLTIQWVLTVTNVKVNFIEIQLEGPMIHMFVWVSEKIISEEICKY